MADLDRLIKSLYFAAAEEPGEVFRAHALKMVCETLGACGGAWHTRSSHLLPGEFNEFPYDAGMTREQLLRVEFHDNKRALVMDPLPSSLMPGGKGGAETGHLVRFSHRSAGDLISTVLIRFVRGRGEADAEQIRRAIGHMVEASTLSLHIFIQRDEWLQALGRPNRGAAAIIDDHGAIYVASRRFKQTLSMALGEQEFYSLPCQPPREAIEEQGGFVFGDLHFRVSKHSRALYMVYVRNSLPLDSLSPREQQIARALANGKTFKSVARQYAIAISTVANHASRIYKKLGIFRREELVDLLRKPGEKKPALGPEEM